MSKTTLFDCKIKLIVDDLLKQVYESDWFFLRILISYY